MVCTQSIREGPEERLCQGNGCVLSPASPPWETGSEMSDSSICSQSQVQQHCCNRGSRLLPVGGNIFDPEAGFTRPPTPQWIPAPASNSWEKPPWLQMRLRDLPPARHCWLLCPTRHQGWVWGTHSLPATGQGQSGQLEQGYASCKGKQALLGMLRSLEEASLPQPSRTPSCLEAKVSTSVLRTQFLLQKSSFFSKDMIFTC